ncbi:MAG TPA: ABC transporter permease [Bryobacteraceae bacterium]|nr:ABC transporter permease [Bryobacteraceae bacterium]
MVHDLRYAIRILIQGRGVTALAILALALGIGANTTIFSVVNAVLFRPLPYRDPDGLVSVLQRSNNPLGAGDFSDIRTESRSFDRIAAVEAWSASLTGREAPEDIVGMHVTQDFFTLLGVAPLRGRALDASDFSPGKDHVVVIGYGMWQRSFSGAGDIVGKKILLDNDPYTVVGVMPRSFYFAPFWITQAEMWAPADLAASFAQRGGGSLRGFARLAAGVDRSRAQVEMNQIASRLAAAYPDSDTGLTLVLDSLPEQASRNIRPALRLLLGAVGFVLLIACANVANLALARATARQREIAVRLSLGAPRSRIVRQLLTESVVLALAGASLGLALAAWGTRALGGLLQPDRGAYNAHLLRWDQVNLDWTVLLFTLALAVGTGILFGLAPALTSARGNVNESLKEGSRGSTSSGGTLRRSLAGAEIAVALVLLIGAGLLLRSFLRLRAADPGFDPRNVVTMTISVAGRPDYVGASRENLYRNILERVSAVPGVLQASMTNHLPLAGDQWGFPYWIEGQTPPPHGKEFIAVYRSSRPNYFATMRAPMVAGRDFNDRDTAAAPLVVIINQKLAHLRFAGQNPLGQRICFSDPRRDPKWMTIVGVVGDLAQAWGTPPDAEVYTPYQQDPRLTGSTKSFAAYMTLVARTGIDATSATAAVRNAVWSVDPNLPLSHVQTLDHAIGNSTWQSRFSLILIGLFSVIALILAMIGIYGVMAYEVAQRTHEIGIRMALGARRAVIMRLIARQSLPVALIGIVCGLAAAAALVRLMRSLLYQVDATDPLTFASVAFIVLIVAILAAVIPARRAMNVDPMIALRQD